MRAIVAVDEIAALALAARINASHGLPRCDRLSGRCVFVGHAGVTCPCTRADAPHAACTLATRAELLPVTLRDGTVAVPVREIDATLAALTPLEAAAIETIDGTREPILTAAAAKEPRIR